MDQMKTGGLIRLLRQRQNMTQLELAEKIGVSDKAVSKWERGCGAPDVSLLRPLAEALGVDVRALLRGELGENAMTNGSMKRMRFYVCPNCHNLLFAMEDAEVSCCGQRLEPLKAREALPEERLSVEVSDGELYVTSGHEMRRDHYISFIALLDDNQLSIRKQYPEWSLEARLPRTARGTLLWYCTRDGLFCQEIGKR